MRNSFIAILLVCSGPTFGQDTIYVSNENSVLLVFDAKFKGQIGNKQYMVKVDDNTLQLGALQEGAFDTFLKIEVPSTGEKLYFVVRFKKQVEKVLYDYTTKYRMESNEKEVVNFSSSSATNEGTNIQSDAGGGTFSDSLEVIRGYILDDTEEKLGYAVIRDRMIFRVINFYIYEGYIVWVLGLENQGSIDFDVQFFDFTMDAGKGFGRRAIGQKTRLKIIKTWPVLPVRVVSDQVEKIMIVTSANIKDTKGRLDVIAQEKDNKRLLKITLPVKDILKARRVYYD
jgi:hypothetical protein